MTFRIHGYPKIYNLGHPAIETLFDTPVVVQEKTDGSQLSWAWDIDGQLHVRSKGSVQYGPERTEPDDLFAGAVEFLLGVDEDKIKTANGTARYNDTGKIYSSFIFRGEWFKSPKHNTIAYDRRPHNGIMLFDIEYTPNEHAPNIGLVNWADYLGIECVPFFELGSFGPITLELIQALLDRESVLGGHKIEGVVIKAFDQFTRDGKVMMGKLVSEAFKEKHKREWKGRGENVNIVDELIASLNTPQRWDKAVQHLRDDGNLESTPRDIGPLMKEIKRDVLEEEEEWIKQKLYDHYIKRIGRAVGRGFPEHYKAMLAERQFDGD